MGDELKSSTCSGTWWCSSARCGGADGQLASCSASVVGDPGGSFGWSPAGTEVTPAGSFGNSPSASCITFQESQTLRLSDRLASIPAMETASKLSFCGLSQPSVDHHWSQSFLAENPEMYSLKDTSYEFFTDPSSSGSAMNNIPQFSSFGTPFLNNFLGDEARSSCPTTHHDQFQNMLKSSRQKNFLNDDTFIDINENWAFCSSRPMQLTKSSGLMTEEKPKSYIHTMKPDSKGFRNTSSAPVLKRPRIDCPSPLPTLKVRKEKLCDRITALQQLVSPFGKTDTASVLYEAIEYIKFLHDQVRTLSSPYFQSGVQINNQQNLEGAKDDQISQKHELRNRGLCLVPISSTFAVACSEIPSIDFWVPPAFDLSYI